MPFVPSENQNLPSEDFRARYRCLDLRRPALSDNLRKRSEVARIVRDVLYEQEFLEVETPILLKSTPEGAREFLVPTRITKHSNGVSIQEPHFYALPQSPQQPKQLLICSGAVDRYFQLAKCFRDEDRRKDRQPEFTQIDLEMAFVSWGEVLTSSTVGSGQWRIGGSEVRDVVESIIRKVWLEMEGVTLPGRFEVITYHDAMTRYGSDKPDTRFGLELSDLSHLLLPASRTVMDSHGKTIECLIIRPPDGRPSIATNQVYRIELDPAVERIALTEDNKSSWVLESETVCKDIQPVSEVQVLEINEALRLKVGDTVYLAARSKIPEACFLSVTHKLFAGC